MLIGLLYALISALCFGISNAWWKKAVAGDDFSRIVFYRGLLAVSLFGLCWLLLHNSGVSPLLVRTETAPLSAWLLAVLLCIGCSFGLLFYLSSLRYAPVSIAVPLSSVNVFSILTAVFILRENFRPVYYLCFLLAGSGAWLLSKNTNRSDTGGYQGYLYAVLAALFWGTTYALFWYPARWLGAIPLAFLLETCVVLLALVWNLIQAPTDMKIYRRPSITSFGHYAFLSFLLVGGTLFFNLAIQLTDVLLLNLTGNFSLITSVLLGWWLLRERIGRRTWAGIGLLLASLLLSQLF